MLKKEAIEITGGLSAPSKMPGPAFNLPAGACQTGAILAQIEGTPCFDCYALKGRYRFPNVKAALNKRLEKLYAPRWVEAIAVLINGRHWQKPEPVFRWHDSGDIQSAKHLTNIFEVCKGTPDTRHWLPTQERKYLQFLDPGIVPPNLIIRLSGSKIDGPAPKSWPWTSSVTSDHDLDNCAAFRTNKTGHVHSLKAFNNFTKERKKELDLGHCGSCRNCWNKDISSVAYRKH
tara:strand:- start:767 stop:1462 length:696 start_codon:yes stop_codon:yes gene_type:complete